MKTWIAAATLLLTATSALAETPVPPAHAAAEASAQDPLARQILSRQITQHNGGVTAAVRVGSGQAVELKLADPTATDVEPLKDAVADPSVLSGLKTAPGLTPKVRKAPKTRAVRRASEQLKTVGGSGWGKR